MTPTLEHVAWLACGIMGYLLVHVSLTVLETRSRLCIQRHDLVVKARKMRAEYWESVAERSGETVEIDDDASGVDVEDDEVVGTVGPDAEPQAELRPAA